jgi:hypothetical protein
VHKSSRPSHSATGGVVGGRRPLPLLYIPAIGTPHGLLVPGLPIFRSLRSRIRSNAIQRSLGSWRRCRRNRGCAMLTTSTYEKIRVVLERASAGPPSVEHLVEAIHGNSVAFVYHRRSPDKTSRPLPVGKSSIKKIIDFCIELIRQPGFVM